MNKCFVSDKSITQLGIYTDSKFIVVKENSSNFNIGDILTLHYDDGTCSPSFKCISRNMYGYIPLYCLAYYNESSEFVRGERVMTENGERIFLTKIEGAGFPYVVVDEADEYEFRENEKFRITSKKECSKLPTVQEMTMEEVEKALGKKVKIIS